MTGLTAPVGECDPGFFCPQGQSVPNPTDYPCPIGLHCPQGSPLPVPCEPGTFTNLTQEAECLVCPEGYYCVPEEVIEGEWGSRRGRLNVILPRRVLSVYPCGCAAGIVQEGKGMLHGC